MGLSGALQIGRSGLMAHQAAIEVTGNNLANLATRGYHRQVIGLAPSQTQHIGGGIHMGRGVEVATIQRAVDAALESRLRASVGDQAASFARTDILGQIEALQNELSDIDLSTALNQFFNAWSDLANQPLDNSLRSLLVQQGSKLGSFIRGLRDSEVELRNQVDQQIDQATIATNDLLTRIESINAEIAAAEGGGSLAGGASALRDQRDLLLGELSEYLDLSIVEQNNGVVDIFVGSLPIVLNGTSRGVEVKRETVNGELQIQVVVADDGSPLQATSGKIGALIASRDTDVGEAIGAIDQFANQLIFQINRLHSQGQGLSGFNSIAGTNGVLDTTVALNDAQTGLNFTPVHGSFKLHLTQVSTGQRNTAAIDVDLDGIGTDTSLDDLVTAINGIANVSATLTADGRLKLDGASADFEISFSEDTSGVLATLGINSFFTGGDGSDIDVNSIVAADGGKVAAALGHVPGDNRNALAIAALRTEGVADLNGLSLSELWSQHIEDFAIRLGQSSSQVEADTIVRESLEAQQQSLSGVNPDEEAINLLSFQRAYQGSARFLTVVDEMLETLLGLI